MSAEPDHTQDKGKVKLDKYVAAPRPLKSTKLTLHTTVTLQAPTRKMYAPLLPKARKRHHC
ncbi:MAG: hypothetical protein INR71_11200 [Terriglobus roseus]|nr:hypothetical protein [Terriglobus roseus]